jgi:hypothetical protein
LFPDESDLSHKRSVDVHEFRSTARKCMANCTDASLEEAGMCLAHTLWRLCGLFSVTVTN